MRIRLHHEMRHHFDPPARGLMQILRVSPRDCESQHVVDWRIDLDVDCRLTRSEDAYGNLVHTFTLDGPVPDVTITIEGDVDTFDAAGVVRGAAERFAPELFLRETPLTRVEAPLRTLARAVRAGAENDLDAAHRLMGAIHQAMGYERAAPESQPIGANAAIAAGKGDTRDFAHAFVAGAREIGLPARVVAGYRIAAAEGGQAEQRLWVEAHIADIGWIAFDAAAGFCPDETYLRVACGLDWLDVAPLRASHASGGAMVSRHRIDARGAVGATQSQSQSQG